MISNHKVVHSPKLLTQWLHCIPETMNNGMVAKQTEVDSVISNLRIINNINPMLHNSLIYFFHSYRYVKKEDRFHEMGIIDEYATRHRRGFKLEYSTFKRYFSYKHITNKHYRVVQDCDRTRSKPKGDFTTRRLNALDANLSRCFIPIWDKDRNVLRISEPVLIDGCELGSTVDNIGVNRIDTIDILIDKAVVNSFITANKQNKGKGHNPYHIIIPDFLHQLRCNYHWMDADSIYRIFTLAGMENTRYLQHGDTQKTIVHNKLLNLVPKQFIKWDKQRTKFRLKGASMTDVLEYINRLIKAGHQAHPQLVQDHARLHLPLITEIREAPKGQYALLYKPKNA